MLLLYCCRCVAVAALLSLRFLLCSTNGCQDIPRLTEEPDEACPALELLFTYRVRTRQTQRQQRQLVCRQRLTVRRFAGQVRQDGEHPENNADDKRRCLQNRIPHELHPCGFRLCGTDTVVVGLKERQRRVYSLCVSNSASRIRRRRRSSGPICACTSLTRASCHSAEGYGGSGELAGSAMVIENLNELVRCFVFVDQGLSRPPVRLLYITSAICETPLASRRGRFLVPTRRRLCNNWRFAVTADLPTIHPHFPE